LDGRSLFLWPATEGNAVEAFRDQEMPLRRALGLPALTFYGVGIILGAGIYSVIGTAARPAGTALWLSFAFSSLVALFTAFSYAELATAYPRASAEFTYLRRAVPSWPGLALVTGLLVALSGAATAATVAIAFAGYLQIFVTVPHALVAWGLVVAATAINIAGVKESGWVNAAFTLLEAGGLILFVVVGASSDRFGAAFLAAPHFGIASGAALVFFSFLGFENIANLAEEARKPERDLPRAIFLSLVIATTLYILVAVAAVALLPPDQLGEAQAPLADAARARSPMIAGALGGIALFATANTALVSILVASRVIFGMAREHALPASIAAVLPRRKTPWIATLVVAATSAALVPFGKVGVVASLSSFASLLAFAAVNVALILLRRREPAQKRHFRVPGAIGWFPVLPAVGVLLTLGIATQLDGKALLSGTVAVAIFAGYAVWNHRSVS
jgi:basic amino acid/polyamine antiporter, APA family